MIKFYDTCSLLLKADNLFDDEEQFAISSITLQELENIKTANNKDEDVKYNARKILHLLTEHLSEYKLVLYQTSLAKPILKYEFELTNDTKILACYLQFCKNHPKDNVQFITNDLALRGIAQIYTHNLGAIEEEITDDYSGYKEVIMSNDEMNEFYSNPSANPYDLHINEYIIIKNEDKEIVDRLCWTGTNYRNLNFKSFNSRWFGEIKPIKGDVYQQLACDSLINNKITLLGGPAGSGKTMLSLGFLMNQLEYGKIDKIIIFCNTVAAKNAAKLGYLPGSREDKLLDSQIGNLLISKFGDKMIVEDLINTGKLMLLPCSDIRGFDTSGMRAGIYISEAQNLDITLMKLALQRIGDDSICIIDGDATTQVDDIHFAGANNGMRRLSKVFRGHDIYGQIHLKNIHRSAIALIAQDM